MKGKMLVIPSILLVLALILGMGIIGCEEEPAPEPEPTPAPEPEPTPTPEPEPEPEPEPKPAAFTLSNLSIQPTEVYIMEDVTISVLVSNTGDLEGSHEVAVKVGKFFLPSQEVTLEGGAKQTVTFTTRRNTAGTFAVTAADMSGTFTVKEPPPPPEPEPGPAAAVISWEEAINYIDEEVTVCGPIIDTLDIGTDFLLGMGTSIMEVSSVGIQINPSLVGDLPDDKYVGQEICVSGTPYVNPNGGASIIVTDLSQISLPGEAAGEPAAGIPWEEVKDHIGEIITATGPIIDIMVYEGDTVLGMGVSIYESTTVGIQLDGDDPAYEEYVGKTITVTGTVVMNPYGGGNIDVDDPSTIVVVE